MDLSEQAENLVAKWQAIVTQNAGFIEHITQF